MRVWNALTPEQREAERKQREAEMTKAAKAAAPTIAFSVIELTGKRAANDDAERPAHGR